MPVLAAILAGAPLIPGGQSLAQTAAGSVESSVRAVPADRAPADTKVNAGPAPTKSDTDNRPVKIASLFDIDPIPAPIGANRPVTVLPRQSAKPPEFSKKRYVTLVIGGDLGFGGSTQPVSPTAGVRHGRRYPYARLTRHLGPLLDSDIAFANLESVVTATNGLSAVGKAFNFRMHPNGVEHLAKLGFNLLSTANNHAIDYGTTGLRHTLRHLDEMQAKGLLTHHGVGATRAAVFKPSRFARNGATFAFAAAGIGGIAATETSPGQASYRSASDFRRMVGNLSETPAEYRMLSVHYGQELQVRPAAKDKTKLGRVAVGAHGIDLVIGHHAHTPAGIQRVGDRLVFYGLGNLLHLGMQDMGKYSRCRDFGLLAKLHLVGEMGATGERMVAKAVEIYALADMHAGGRVRRGRDGRRRIEVINHLSAALDGISPDVRGLRFAHQADGSGLYCAPGSGELGGAVGRLCANWLPAPMPDGSTRRNLRQACGYRRKNQVASSKTATPKKLRGTVSKSQRKRRWEKIARSAFQSEN